MGSGNFPLSADADAIRASIQRRQLREVYHYTPIGQVPGIVQHGGIYPRDVLRRRGIPFNDDPSRWSNRVEKAEAMTGYVAVSIARPWGMMQHEPDCVVFGIGSDVLLRVGTAFMGAWSSRREIQNLDDVIAREGIESFDAMFDNPTTNWQSELLGEILVKGTILREDISRLYVRSQDHLVHVNRVCAEAGVQARPPYGTQIASWIFGRGG